MILSLCSNHRMNEPEQRKECWGRLQWGVVVLAIMILSSLILPTWNMIADMSAQTSAANNCRQIIMALRKWANDNNGVFPDAGTPPPKSSNQAFRKLIQDKIIQDERIFGNVGSPFQPNNELGDAPDYPRALEPGENHWAMMAGLKIDNDGTLPLIFESTASSQWPPQWFEDTNPAVRGRTWQTKKYIVGCLDSSVNVGQLVEEDGLLNLSSSLRQLFNQGNHCVIQFPRILDIEEKK